ncbi:MAG: metallophosphoesterase family protein [Clostridia bacterium]|nr:metallophosphoesterase family protein [Clostridia bacterium]
MKIALLGDLHGNWAATCAMDKALKTIAPDEIWFLGDSVGKGPSSDKTCDWVRQNCTVCVGGNWDYGIGFKEFSEDQYFWDMLGEERMAWLRSLPDEAELVMSGIRFRLFHGRPKMPLMSAQDSRELLEATFVNGEEKYGGVIFADSHRAFIRTLNTGYMINTGSVGINMGVTRAHCLIMEGEKDAMEPGLLQMNILSVPYDRDAALAEVDEHLPHKDSYINEILTGVYSRNNNASV